jgi:hypothetical protein
MEGYTQAVTLPTKIPHQRPPPLLHPDMTACKLKQITSYTRLVEFQWIRGLQNLSVNFHQCASFLESAAVDEPIVNVDRWNGRMVHRIADLKKLLQVPYG